MQPVQSHAQGKRIRVFAMRLICIFATTVGIMKVIRSKWLGDLMQHSFVGPVVWDAFPILLFGFLLTGFLMVHRKDAKELHKNRTSVRQYLIAGACLIATIIFSYIATHPSLERFYSMHNFINAHAVIGGPIVAAMLYASLFAPAVPAAFLFLPPPFIRHHAIDLAFLGGILLLYFTANVFDAAFHMLVAPTILQISAAILSLFPGSVSVEPEHLRLSFESFSVVIGPVCTGLNLFALFTAVFLYMWYKTPKIRHAKARVAFAGGIVLLFFLNILRIVLIMLIGAHAPAFATTLFHSSAGIVILALVCAAYVRWVFPRLQYIQYE